VQSKEQLLSRFHRILSPVLQADEAPVEVQLHPGQGATLHAYRWHVDGMSSVNARAKSASMLTSGSPVSKCSLYCDLKLAYLVGFRLTNNVANRVVL
jgi:hypothetical protein